MVSLVHDNKYLLAQYRVEIRQIPNKALHTAYHYVVIAFGRFDRGVTARYADHLEGGLIGSRLFEK